MPKSGPNKRNHAVGIIRCLVCGCSIRVTVRTLEACEAALILADAHKSHAPKQYDKGKVLYLLPKERKERKPRKKTEAQDEIMPVINKIL